MQKKRLILLIFITVFIASFFIFDLGQYFTLEFFNAKHTVITNYYHANPLQTGLIYFVLYILVTSLSLPGAGIMTLIAGAIFGLLWGTVLVSFASTIGATVAFLVARYLFKEIVQKRFSDKLQTINAGIERDGAFYLFTLRLIPLFPFFIINLVMGLTPIRTGVFAIVSQIGMLPVTVIFVNAGIQIAKISRAEDILSLELLVSLILIGVFPLIAKKTVELIRSRKEQAGLKQNE